MQADYVIKYSSTSLFRHLLISNISYNYNMKSFTSVILAALAALAAQQTTAQAPTMCSCSPTVFTFVLSLGQTCNDNDIETNSGIDGSFCFTETGVANLNSNNVAGIEMIEEEDKWWLPIWKQYLEPVRESCKFVKVNVSYNHLIQ